MSTFLLEIVTPERLIYSEQADSLVVRGLEGELGILPGHVPFVTPLQIAPVTIKANGKEQKIAVAGGFVEVRKEKVVILAESAELANEIDVDRARAAKERAETRLSSNRDQFDHRRAELALQKAMNRLKVSGQ
ncbi:F0F1 ATP synthase subunit epsilon [Paenibacillus shunpengii]|uniref:ATP synthase epsilon chain n=1 Tax=Paenibacillus shunpengii TaxID=2054424 RepID=A0ABW5SUW8_9BACL|nr:MULTISPECIES: F0F1 ATP synthase subunit epsilon [unclassified Paenibacillus]OMC66488.1 F0F1 ATP synthase subunit epsilon [Paenibacillus sp. FSL H7-0326]SDW84655.1 ATP synthase F1 subcomplex epsilon subunit [Paenibacillus sp. PDC88]